ncbi:vexin [Empidonax traillii]|uniref:vexin n=1 Tax=Empidonax traillii TaxID=164674 RepID=UPI000FFD6560|nr:vexin [Empidonax traillii]XP_027750500.1 vexin [Empidonax traillii]
MHQIYSCSDENLEVFTTVISSKSCSPARRRAKTTQHILTKTVVAIPERRPRQAELLQVLYGEDEVRSLDGQRGPCPAKGTARHVGINEQESSKSCNHLLDGKSLIPSSPVAHITVKAVAVRGSPTRDCTSTDNHRHRWRKTTEYDLALPPGAEASLPLTGGNLCGTPSLLRKMWMKHKKKSEYLGATNSAFEAD